VPLPAFGDALAPGLVLAQAIGRWGNWFNQELFGRPTDLPWGLRIDPENRPEGYEQFETFHPTFLYESLWNVGVAVLVVWADRRFRLGHGRAFALYVAAYCVGRAWIEALRIDDAQIILGLRLNEWTSLVVFLGAVVYFVVSARLRPGREVIHQPPRGGHGGDEHAADEHAADEPGAHVASAGDIRGADEPAAEQPQDSGDRERR
jgi:prolipoprotein diacylglyceryl transferase